MSRCYLKNHNFLLGPCIKFILSRFIEYICIYNILLIGLPTVTINIFFVDSKSTIHIFIYVMCHVDT